MLQKGLKCRQLKEKIQFIKRELKINNHKFGNGLNEEFIEIIVSTLGKMTPFMKLFREQKIRLFTSSSLSSRDYSLLFFCSCKITFSLGAASKCTTRKCTHAKRFKKIRTPKARFSKLLTI